MAVKNPECPICGETFEDGRGLSGHLQFKHSLSGDEHKRELDKGMDRGEKRQSAAPAEVGGRSGRSVRDRELELKGMLHEIREEKEEIPTLGPWVWKSSDKERLSELNRREQEICDELERLQGDG